MVIKIATISDELTKAIKKLDKNSVMIVDKTCFMQNTILINIDNSSIRFEIKDDKIILKSVVGGRGYKPVILESKDYEYIKIR